MGPSLESVDEVVEEIMRIHRSLPARPSMDELEAATTVLCHVDGEEQSQLDSISKQKKGFQIPDELFFILQEMQKNLVFFQCKEQKREALQLLDLENIHVLFDEMIQKASTCFQSPFNKRPLATNSVPSYSMQEKGSDCHSKTNLSYFVAVNSSEKEAARKTELITRDDTYVKRAKATMDLDGPSLNLTVPQGLFMNSSPVSKPTAFSEADGGKLSLIKLTRLIEVYAKEGTPDLILKNKLVEQVERIPDSFCKLLSVVTLDLSENRILALPNNIGALKSLKKLSLHTNRIAELPDSIGQLSSLLCLNLSGNRLTSLPSTIGELHHLEELYLSSNQLFQLSDAIGNLVSLKKLDVETNNIEELPYNIGNCISIVELRADYNRLKALPEAVGKLEALQILTVRYNNMKGLPTTMASLSKLKEIDASFNELESIPESLCLAVSITKLNIGNNFANLQSLPRSIGNLEMLEELDISNNQIRVLPDSFRMLSQLKVLHAEENPFDVPPRHLAEKGAQVVVQYMADLVATRDVKSQKTKTKNTWSDCCFFSTPCKQKSVCSNSNLMEWNIS